MPRSAIGAAPDVGRFAEQRKKPLFHFGWNSKELGLACQVTRLEEVNPMLKKQLSPILPALATAVIFAAGCGSRNAEPMSAPAEGEISIATYGEGHEVPATTSRGIFSIERGCLVFRSPVDGKTYSPIFPPGTEFSSGAAASRRGLIICGTSIALGQIVVFDGAPGQFGPPKTTDDGCPREQIIVGSIKEKQP